MRVDRLMESREPAVVDLRSAKLRRGSVIKRPGKGGLGWKSDSKGSSRSPFRNVPQSLRVTRNPCRRVQLSQAEMGRSRDAAAWFLMYAQTPTIVTSYRHTLGSALLRYVQSPMLGAVL